MSLLSCKGVYDTIKAVDAVQFSAQLELVAVKVSHSRSSCCRAHFCSQSSQFDNNNRFHLIFDYNICYNNGLSRIVFVYVVVECVHMTWRVPCPV